MNVRLKRAKELMGYAVQLTKDEGLPTMVKRGAGFVRRRFFGKRARYLPGKKVLEAQAAEMVGKTAENCGLPTISILTPLYNTPENYLREFLGSFVNQTAPNGQLCLADASDDAHPDVERVVREYQQKNQRIVYKKVENKGIAANTNAAETLATGEYLALADHDDVLAPHAMYAMGKAVLQLREKGEPDGFLYSDEALFTKDIKKPMVGHFKPDYAPDYLLCCNYICHLAVFKRALYEQLGGERPECDGSQDHDLFLRLIEQVGGALVNAAGIGDQTASGPLCVCRTPEEVPEKFHPGDVLVVPYTNNELLPYMKEAAAVISEELSPEGHTATVGLLLHKPVIIGAVHATRRLHDGVQVSVDCARGIVQVMPQ